MDTPTTRRQWLEQCGAGIGGALLTLSPTYGQHRPERVHTYWGDLHNHNHVGYAQGSLERTYEIARERLGAHDSARRRGKA